MTESALDKQVGGDHYKKYGEYQPWVVCAKWLSPEELLGLAKGTAIWYLARDKNGREDIEKAMHTLQLYLEVSATKNEPGTVHYRHSDLHERDALWDQQTPIPRFDIKFDGPRETVHTLDPEDLNATRQRLFNERTDGRNL